LITIYKISLSRWFSIFFSSLVLLGAVFLSGCSHKGTGQFPTISGTGKGGAFIEKLRSLAVSVTSVTVTGRVSLTLNGKQLPSVKVRAYLVSKVKGDWIRIRGFGPFGVTVFDLLAKGNMAWLYLPRQGRYYEGSRFFTKYGNMDVKTAVTVIEMLLNPWSPARLCSLEPMTCPQGESSHVCLKGNFLERSILFVYRYDLVPERFYCRDIELKFFPPTIQGELYPKGASFFFKNANINGKLIINKAVFNSLSGQEKLFDQGLFKGKM